MRSKLHLLKGPTCHPISLTPFEAFHDGSWHGVQSIRIKNGFLLVKLSYSGSTVELSIDGDCLRARSRRATWFDCSHVLKPGVDVCVQSLSHQVALCHDARLVGIKRNHNEDQCLYLFATIPYKNQCAGNKEVIINRREEVVTIDDVFLLQKLKAEELRDGSVQWTSTEDCFSRNRSKLLSARFSSEIAYLIVLSVLKKMEFKIKLVEGKIIYQMVVGGQGRRSLDSMSIPSALSNSCMEIIPFKKQTMKTMSFQLRDETSLPVIRNIPITPVKQHNLSEERRFTMKGELDCVSAIDIFYEHVDLRRSKRLKTQPERFTSYDAPNFNRDYKKKQKGASSTKSVNSRRALHRDFPVEVESLSAEVPGNITMKQTGVGSVTGKEKTSATGQHNNTANRTPCSSPVQEKRSSVEVREVKVKSTTEQRASDSHISGTPAQNKEKHPRQPQSFQRKSFNSSHSLYGSSEPAFCQKVGKKRKNRVSERECNEMIDEWAASIQSEMERGSEFKLHVPTMNYSYDAYQQEDFTWPSSADSQEEKDELEDLWKEMDYSLTTLALLEQKQNPVFEAIHGSTAVLGRNGGIPCHHDCILDEEFGLTCRLCNVVCTEANDIFPQMFNGKDYKERPGCSDFCNDAHVLDPSLFASSGPEFSELKSSGSLWNLIPDIEPKLLFHQKKAFEFIWKNLAGSLQLEQMDNSTANTGGCVVAHTPGSGKTLLMISFLVSYLKLNPRSPALVLTPKAAIHTWRREFERWGISLPLYVLPDSSGKGKQMKDIDPKLQAVLNNFPRTTSKNVRLVNTLDKLYKWRASPSVLLMTYSYFLGVTKEWPQSKKGPTKEDSEMESPASIAKFLMDNPGPLILDEGHNPRSTKSKSRKMLMNMDAKFRILLSGTVFQNNFEEYFNTLSLARPRFVHDVMTVLAPERNKGTGSMRSQYQEAVARRIFVERVGQKIASNDNSDIIDGIKLLNKLTCGFVDSFEGTKLSNLPGIHVYTLFMKPAGIQEEILAKPPSSTVRHSLEVELLTTIGSIHPWLIKTTKCASTFFTPSELDEVDKYKRDFTVGCKAKFVIDLLHKSSYRGERVLIFCHNVTPINFLVNLIETVFGWRLGEEVLVLQGDQELSVRSDIMDKFNGDIEGKRKVLLASTTACAEGISLIGASRVVMLDSEWNHSKTRQAIARAFRPGQERTVYVYLLVATGTWEEGKYGSNRRKAWVSKMVFFGRYLDDPLQHPVTTIDDEVLKELADEDDTKTFHMIVKQD